MTIFVPVKDVESRANELLAELRAGQSVVVTYHGQPLWNLKLHDPSAIVHSAESSAVPKRDM